MVQDKLWLWIAWSSGYDYAQWGQLEKADPELISHLSKEVGSYYEDKDYRYWVNHKKTRGYSIGRRPKSDRAMAEHVRLANEQKKAREDGDEHEQQQQRQPLAATPFTDEEVKALRRMLQEQKQQKTD